MGDIRAQQAREHHLAAQAAEGKAVQHRVLRDRLVRSLRESDPESWSYGRLAKAIGCSPELVAAIVKEPRRRAGPRH